MGQLRTPLHSGRSKSGCEVPKNDLRRSRSFSMDVRDLEVVACRSVALGTAGTEGKRSSQGRRGSGEADLTEAGETGESLGTPGFLTALAG